MAKPTIKKEISFSENVEEEGLTLSSKIGSKIKATVSGKFANVGSVIHASDTITARP